jgi:hypothetical protein
MKSNFLLVFLIAFVFYCHQPAAQKAKNDSGEFVKNEIEKWKKELLISGEVGSPCLDNIDKWSAQNPDRFYGLPKEPIKTKTFDANNDKVDDILLYFPAGDCCSCSVGMNEGSDFLKLIYSDGTEFLSNDHLREKIAAKIEGEYFAQTNTDVEHAIFSVTNFDTEISGTFKLWTLEDPDCCASVEGTFKYDPFTWKIELKQHKMQ